MNIYEIAEKSGVSPATVSRVINGSVHVSEAAKKKVNQVIEDYGYVPNFFARGLNLKKTKTVGILCPVISDLNHAKQVAELEHRLRRFGYDIIMCSVEKNYEGKSQYLELLLQKHVDAVFLIGIDTNDKEGIDALAATAKNVPVIIINGFVDLPNIYSVCCNEKVLAENIVKQLYLSGSNRIMYIYDTNTYSGQQKRTGYEVGMKSCDMDYEGLELYISEEISMSDLQKSAQLIEAFVSEMNEKPDAVLCADDILASPAEKAFRALGLRPQIIGWHNSLYAQISTPTLTSVDINVSEMSDIAVTMLSNLLEEKRCPKFCEVMGEVVIRESCIL